MREKTVLLIADDPQTAQTFLLLLAAPGSPALRWTSRLRDGLRLLSVEGPFEAVLLDLALGPQALPLVRARAPGLPVVALAEPGGEARGAAAVARGAWDYQVKGRLHARLPAAAEAETAAGAAPAELAAA